MSNNQPKITGHTKQKENTTHNQQKHQWTETDQKCQDDGIKNDYYKSYKEYKGKKNHDEERNGRH